MTPKKRESLKRMSTKDGLIAALAIDQRGSLKKMLRNINRNKNDSKDIIQFKKMVSSELTPYSSAILLDPEYGLPAAKARAINTGLLVAYEKTGYDTTEPGRMPDLLADWSVKRLKELGADSVKFLLYYDVDEDSAINDKKQAFIERIGSECAAEELPFFCELVSYDAHNNDTTSTSYAKIKPHKVIEMMREFSKPRYQIDVLKVEVPVNMNYVEGFADEHEIVYSRKEALELFKMQSDITNLPYIFLSAGVTSKLFQETLFFAHEAGAQFNGVLCGRATWRGGVEPFAKFGDAAGKEWFNTIGKQNIESLNDTLAKTATSWFDKVQ